jgi:arabinogalactan oligomer / maltooligosaccharide transport system permease protein
MIRKPKRLMRVVQIIILVLFSFIALYPVWFAVLAAGRKGDSLYTFNLSGMFFPVEWTWNNFQRLFTEQPFWLWVANSLKVATFTVIFAMIVVTSAAFAFSRFQFKGRSFGLTAMLGLQAYPGLLSLSAITMILTAIGLYGSHVGLVLAYTTGVLVFATWNLKGYFDTIPIDLEEAGMIDGCGPVQSFFLIALPLARPALAITALLAFLAGWSDYVLASSIVPAPDTMKLAVPGLYGLSQSVSIPWGMFAAGFCIVVIPTIMVFLFLQRYLEAGLTLGGVKG